MLLPSGNPFKCHEEVLYFQLLIPPKRFDILSPRLGDAAEGLLIGAFRFFFKYDVIYSIQYFLNISTYIHDVEKIFDVESRI